MEEADRHWPIMMFQQLAGLSLKEVVHQSYKWLQYHSVRCIS